MSKELKDERTKLKAKVTNKIKYVERLLANGSLEDACNEKDQLSQLFEDLATAHEKYTDTLEGDELESAMTYLDEAQDRYTALMVRLRPAKEKSDTQSELSLPDGSVKDNQLFK